METASEGGHFLIVLSAFDLKQCASERGPQNSAGLLFTAVCICFYGFVLSGISHLGDLSRRRKNSLLAWVL